MLNVDVSRRRLLGGMGAIGAATLVGLREAQAALPERRLAFHNVHTNERFDARFMNAGGSWDEQGLAELNHGLRDWRNNEVMPMDRQLIMLVSQIRDTLGVAPQQRVDLISGYRSPQTNSALRTAGGEHTGVASKSQHMLGKATDIRMPGVALAQLHMAALSMQAGGVGFYPKDGFVHVDTGRVRQWGGV